MAYEATSYQRHPQTRVSTSYISGLSLRGNWAILVQPALKLG